MFQIGNGAVSGGTASGDTPSRVRYIPPVTGSGQRVASRRAIALAALWLVGFELLPNLHIALHAHLAHHHHDGNPTGLDELGTTRVEVTFTPLRTHPFGIPSHQHHHGLLDLTQRSSAPPDHEVWLLPTEPVDGPGHGAHSLAHRHLVMVQPPPVAIAAAPLPVSTVEADRARGEVPRSRRPLVRRVRGPPVT